MKLFGFDFSRKADLTIDQVIKRLEAALETGSGVVVTPETCEESPTVQAIVNAISMHIGSLPVHVYRKGASNGRETKEPLPNHTVARLLSAPNEWQTPVNYWMDMASVLVRYGRFVAVKLRGQTGPIRSLLPVNPSAVDLKQDPADLSVIARVRLEGGGQHEYRLSDLHYVRGRACDFLNGDSPVTRAREAIGLEIAAQRFGAAFFGNGAMPGIMFKVAQGYKMTDEQRNLFVQSFQAAYSSGKRFKAMLPPAGIEKDGEAIAVENDKAQFLETRKLQRSIIAGAFGVPPHLVGDLERGTFSNIEHQSQEFVQKVVMPYVRIIEDAMERDLLTVDDRRQGIVVRFNMDSVLRGDFKSRQDGLKIQRESGVISPNEWREREGMNPISKADGGDSYWQQGPSGQTGRPARDPDYSNNPAQP